MSSERISVKDSVNKYSSDVPFSGETAEIKSIEQQTQQIIDNLVPVVQNLVDALVPTIESCVDVINHLWDEILKSYPDNRVVWLAFHHKKARVRKKNRHRIAKYIAKAVNADD